MKRKSIAIAAVAALAVAAQAHSVQAKIIGTHPSIKRANAEAPKTRLAKSPITPGFWSWPRNKPTNAAEVAATCRDGLAVQLSNGRYLTLKLAKGTSPTVVTDQGRCAFDPKTQIERCELTVTDSPTETKKGFIESRYSTEPDGALKMSVTATAIAGPGAPKIESFEIYPVRCPDDTVHDLLTTTFQNK